MNNFEIALKTIAGDKIQDDEFCKNLWSAMANVSWYHPASKEEYSCTFRRAGGLIAGLRGSGDYMDWYCSGPYAEVSDYIARSMKKLGWIADVMPEVCDEPGCLEFVSCGWPTPAGYRSTCSKHYQC